MHSPIENLAYLHIRAMIVAHYTRMRQNIINLYYFAVINQHIFHIFRNFIPCFIYMLRISH